MERQIGERFDYKGKTLEVVKLEDISNWYCADCYFRHLISCYYVKKVTGFCSCELRKDGTDVIFKEVKNENQ